MQSLTRPWEFIMDTKTKNALVNLSHVERMPDRARLALTSAVRAEDSGVTFEKHTFDESYLEFLDTQIELAPRGPAWTELLRARRSAFERCVGDELLRIGVRRGDAEFVGHCRASDGEVLHSEIV